MTNSNRGLATLGLVFACAIPTTLLGDDRQILVDAIERSYTSTRFDRIEVEFSSCEVRVRVEDLQACSVDTNSNVLEYYVDLKDNVPLTDSAATRPLGDTLRTWFRFEASGSWASRSGLLINKYDQLLSKARQEVGWGSLAADLAFDRFSAQHPISTLRAYQVFEYCDGGRSISPKVERLRFHSQDPDLILSTFSRVAEQCLNPS
ncbi:hypothetical protein [Roseobacter sinensis]|uniref:hypothetical protein n=1 Tax=Roseobacter sinensis TaxID=2931391 RepID=UPI0021E7DB71|nr:hypothetical protein [Roseobacter sp. WL0113]